MTFAHSRMQASRVILAAVIAVAGIMLPKAKAQNDAGAKILPASNSTLTGRKIVSSVFETNSTGVNTNCGTSSCEALVPLLPKVALPCPGAIGTTCTFFIQIESANQISSVDQGLYRILVDMHPASPGPVDSSGLYKFVESDPNSDDTHTNSAGIVATVKNTVANEMHHSTVSFGCKDDTGDGCFAFAALSSLRIDIFQP
jgi:hypothetical protein